MLIDLNMNPSPQDGFIVAQDRSFLKPRRSGKSGTSQIVSFEHAKASAALAASCRNGLRGDVETVVEGALNITAYGGSPANPDNGAALAAALNASSGGGGCVSFPPGRFTARCAP